MAHEKTYEGELTYNEIKEIAYQVDPRITFDLLRWYCNWHIADDLTDEGTKWIARYLQGGDIKSTKTEDDIAIYINSQIDFEDTYLFVSGHEESDAQLVRQEVFNMLHEFFKHYHYD